MGVFCRCIHISAWASALLVQTNRAMREPRNVGRVTGTDSRTFLLLTCFLRGVRKSKVKIMKRIFYLIMTLTLVMVGCSQNEMLSPDATIRKSDVKTFNCFNVTTEESPLTRAHIEGNVNMVWDEGDMIGVYSDLEEVVPFTYAGNNTFTSEKAVTGTVFYAYYPYNDENSVDESNRNIINFTLPESFTYCNNSIPLVAVTSSNILHFKQTVGLLHFTLRGKQHIIGLSLESKAKEPIAGAMTVDIFNEEPVITAKAGNETSMVTLNCDIELGADEEKEFYFPVPAVSYTDGYVLIIQTSEGTFFKSKDECVKVERAKMQSYPVFKTDAHSMERAALEKIYYSLDGENWTGNHKWLSDEPYWQGVSVNEDGFVTMLDLTTLWNISGELPLEIGNFLHLEGLYIMSKPNLTGVIPTSIGNLQNLYAIRISGNLSGHIPAELSNLKKLNLLTLNHNNFSPENIPEWIGDMPYLVTLDLNNCNLTGPIPESLSNMGYASNTELVIRLSGNTLEGEIPSSLATNRIFELVLSSNQLTGTIPVEFSNASNLKYFFFDYNNLDGVITEEMQKASWWNDGLTITQNEGHKLTIEGKTNMEFGNDIEDLGDNGSQDW